MRNRTQPQTMPLSSTVRSSTAMRVVALAVSVLLLSVAACSRGKTAEDTSATAAQSTPAKSAGGMGDMKGMAMGGAGDTGGMKGMGANPGGMAGMKGMGAMSGMMGPMQKQMDAMMKISPEQMKAMMPAHRQMAANLLATMTADMRNMNMSGDAAWSATIDSVRRDLATMPELSGKEMAAAMPAHHARMMRLMGMHTTMMKM